VQPDACGDIPLGPVSWYGVARPWADSGLAGTTSTQLTLAAATAAGVAVAVALAVALAVGLVVGLAVPVAVGVAAAPAPWDERFRLAFLSPMNLRPRTRPTAMVMTRGTAISMIRLLRAPDGDQCPPRIKSTSMPLLRSPNVTIDH
jgi:hypothetical protein